MTHKTKIVLASVAAAIIFVPIIIIIIAVFSVLTTQQSASTGVEKIGGYDISSTYSDRMAEAPMTIQNGLAASDEFQATSGSTAAEVDQKIIKTGYLEIVVDSASETAAKISALTTGKGGYAQDISISEDEDGTKYGSITVRIPANEFENTMAEVKKLAVSIETESTAGQDVTEEYTDLEAQLKNAQAQEAEYLVILQKAESVEDILSVQSYLGQVREQIERLQGRIKYLSNLTSYSTITVYLSEEPTINLPSKEFRPWSSIKEAAQAVISVLQSLVITGIWLVILGGGVLIPIVVVIWLVVLLIKKIKHRRHGKK